jgi:hypothetical protein
VYQSTVDLLVTECMKLQIGVYTTMDNYAAVVGVSPYSRQACLGIMKFLSKSTDSVCMKITSAMSN